MPQKSSFIKKFLLATALLSVICISGNSIEQPARTADSSYFFMNEGLNYYNSSDFGNAEAAFRKSINITMNSDSLRFNNLLIGYINMGAIHMMLWNPEVANQYYDSAMVLLRNIGGEDKANYGVLLLNKGNIYLNSRDLKRAEDYYKQALAVFSGLPKTEDVNSYMATLNNNLGLLSEQTGDYEKALVYFNEAIRIRQRQDSKDLTMTMRNKADCLRKLGRLREAEQIHLDNIRFTAQNRGSGHYSLGLVYVSYGYLLETGFRQFEKALEAYSKAFEILRLNYGEKNPYVSNLHRNIGKLHLAANNPGAAAESIQKALIALVPDFNDSNPQSNPALAEVTIMVEFLETLKEKGKAFEMISDRNNEAWPLIISMNTFELATEVIDHMRMGYQSEESKLFLSENQNAIFHDAIRVCYKLYQITEEDKYLEKALYFAEKNKAANLLASIREIGAREFGRIPAQLIENEVDLKRQIAVYTEYVYEENRKIEPDLVKVSLWQQNLFSLNQEYAELVQVLEKNYPDYFRLKYNTSVNGVNEIRKSLGRKDAIIEYSLSDSVIYIFFITRTSLKVIEQQISDEFRENIANILEIFENKRFSSGATNDFRVFTNSAYQLYNILIKPLENLLEGRNLIIIPDGILSYLPFELLISELPAHPSPAYSSLQFLLKKHPVSYAHSATLLNEYAATSAKRGGRLLAFAPKYESNGAQIPDILNSRSRYRDNLKPLPASRVEVRNILSLVGGKLWIDEEATEKNFKEYAPEYKILHLAMHTLIDDLNPMFSKLVFTQDKDSIEDGLLNTFEIYNLSLKASMAVLSSCKSGWGKFQTGEGVLSLARGFLYAGVPSIIMTLWEIEDQSSADVMTLFYKYLKKGKSKDEALRLAKLEFLSKADMLKSHPYFWGGYVAIGDTSPVFYNRNLLIGLSGVIIIIAFLAFSYYARRKRF